MENAPAICNMLAESRPLLAVGPVEPSDTAADARRRRVVQLFETVATASATIYESFLDQLRAASNEDQRTELRQSHEALGEIVHAAVNAIYFGTGAFRAGRAVKTGTRPGESDESHMTPRQRQRAWLELAPTMRALLRVNDPAFTHRLIEGAATFVEFDPCGVFLFIRDAVISGTLSGLQYESLAATTVTKFVETFLADHRTLLQNLPDLRKALLEVLQIFIEWPQARKLVYRLDEIDR
jgi:uncharacterized protein YjiS (DUF1127 family)